MITPCGRPTDSDPITHPGHYPTTPQKAQAEQPQRQNSRRRLPTPAALHAQRQTGALRRERQVDISGVRYGTALEGPDRRPNRGRRGRGDRRGDGDGGGGGEGWTSSPAGGPLTGDRLGECPALGQRKLGYRGGPQSPDEAGGKEEKAMLAQRGLPAWTRGLFLRRVGSLGVRAAVTRGEASTIGGWCDRSRRHTPCPKRPVRNWDG